MKRIMGLAAGCLLFCVFGTLAQQPTTVGPFPMVNRDTTDPILN
jgi:hypothetical protein